MCSSACLHPRLALTPVRSRPGQAINKIVGLAGGTYKVGFDGGEPYVVQYYDDKPAFAAARTVPVTVNDTTPGVDAALERVDRSEGPGSTARAPINTLPPVISGTDAVGEVLTCADGSWTGTPTPTFSVRWLRDGSTIIGATTNSYTVRSADEGHRLACEVTASSTAGEKSAVSAGVPIPTTRPRTSRQADQPRRPVSRPRQAPRRLLRRRPRPIRGPRRRPSRF